MPTFMMSLSWTDQGIRAVKDSPKRSEAAQELKSGCRSCALAAVSSSALGISRRKITHTSTSIWAMPARSFARIARRYSVSIRAWAHMKLIRQIVLTLTWTELLATSDLNSVRSKRQAVRQDAQIAAA